MKELVSKNTLRSRFSAAMSEMYQSEVPLYGTLIDLVNETNNEVLTKHPALKESLQQTNSLSRISQERHGAIRVGKPAELFNIRRLFALMGMHAVAYYDLSVAGIPVHSTAFRSIETEALSVCPFRVFTSLLRIDLIEDQALQENIHTILDKRSVFSEELLNLMNGSEKKGGLYDAEADDFIAQALEVFRWHDEALVDYEMYQNLKTVHPLVADVVSFKGPHINHLTPATLDIDVVQSLMLENNIDAKAVIEGPPSRRCPILLRQTSFKALEESVTFVSENNEKQAGSHTARFGEVEQRGIALTQAGQYLYDRLLAQTRKQALPAGDGSNAKEYIETLEQVFTDFPDTHADLRDQELAYYFYSVTAQGKAADKSDITSKSLDELIGLAYIRFDPIIYEDFLPVSAAGIFQSNLSAVDSSSESVDKKNTREAYSGSQVIFEQALGEKVVDMHEIYLKQQQHSIECCLDFFMSKK